VFGVDLTLGQQVVVIVLAVLTAVGAAGVPGGSLPLMVMILAYAGVPEMGLALILGVDRLLDMCRTTLNVIGDVTAAAYIARSEGFTLLQPREVVPEGDGGGAAQLPETGIQAASPGDRPEP
jgi:DAACS family dicarboxylate/amino acid:cation (Na+ or H+) symporter